MKKGINIWSFPPGFTIAESMALAKQAGFDGIELALGEEGELSTGSSAAELQQIKNEAERHGIEIAGLASGLGWQYGLTSEHREVREKAADIIAKQLEIAAHLGVDTILVVPGWVGVDFMPGNEITDYDAAYGNALTGLKKLAEVAEKYKVSIGVENVWNKFLLSPVEMRAFLDDIGSPYVGSYFDVGNTVSTGYPEHWIKALGGRIKKVHFKDYRREAGGLAGFVDLLAGDVNYPAVVEQLRNIGYTNYVIAEMIPSYRHHGEQIIFNASASMDAILGRDRRRAEA